MSLAARTRRLIDQLAEAQKPRKPAVRHAKPEPTPKPEGPPPIDWQHVQDIAGRGKLPQLVITCVDHPEIPVDEMPDVDDVIRQE